MLRKVFGVIELIIGISGIIIFILTMFRGLPMSSPAIISIVMGISLTCKGVIDLKKKKEVVKDISEG